VGLGHWHPRIPLARGCGSRDRLGHGPFRTTKLAGYSSRGRRGPWRSRRLSHAVGLYGSDYAYPVA